jgi:hypothetical protein
MQVIAAADAARRGRGTFVRGERPCKNARTLVSDSHALKLGDKTGVGCTMFFEPRG